MSDEGQDFFGLFSIVLGVLVGISVLLFILARYVGVQTQDQYILGDEAFQEEVDARIRPIGYAALPGENDASPEPAAAEAAPAKVALTGPQVYNQACFACHGAGIGGAPRVGDAAAWTARIAKGNESLNQNAIQGYQGEAGYMPPKGGRVDLSDQEIIDAVAYMVAESR